VGRGEGSQPTDHRGTIQEGGGYALQHKKCQPPPLLLSDTAKQSRRRSTDKFQDLSHTEVSLLDWVVLSSTLCPTMVRDPACVLLACSAPLFLKPFFLHGCKSDL